MYWYFIGIGGMGMSGLAKILHMQGHIVAGSDRNTKSDYCKLLANLGIKIYEQNGKGIKEFITEHSIDIKDLIVVKSTAIEDQVSDLVVARQNNVKEMMRSDLLAMLFNDKKGIAIAGTAGKTTTSGLAAWLLRYANLRPSFAIGGIVNTLETNADYGNSEYFVIEADESDGSIVKYRPYISILNNIYLDHKPISELKEIFLTYINNTKSEGCAIVNGDDLHIQQIKNLFKPHIVTFGFSENNDIFPTSFVEFPFKSEFYVNNQKFELNLAGKHNILNALAIIALATIINIPLDITAQAIEKFPGIKRRYEKVGFVNGVTVVDDFAHNPAEIEAVIQTTRRIEKQINRKINKFYVYQPHGFGPTSFTKNELVQVFTNLNQENEYLYLDDIYYAGGTVEKNISSEDIVNLVKPRFKNIFYFKDRNKIVEDIASRAQDGDYVVVMGARDINQICKDIIKSLGQLS